MSGEIFANSPEGRDAQNVVLGNGTWRTVYGSAPMDIRLRYGASVKSRKKHIY
jgi:hypothetical protein